MKPKFKAYGIDWDKISEGAYYCGNIGVVYADTVGKAKSLLLPEIQDYKLLYSEEDITFINIPIKREKLADKFDFEGEVLTRWEFEEIKHEKERQLKLDEILNNNNITHCYIYKRGYYKENWCGYTDFEHRAGVYDKKEAINHARNVSEITIYPIDNVKHNEMINNEIIKLQAKIIH